MGYPISVEIQDTECLMPMRKSIPIRDIRDWVFNEVHNQYEMSAAFNMEGLLVRRIPDAIRFTFEDVDTAFLFNIAWR